MEVNDIVIARTGATVGYAKQIKKAVDAVNASYLVRLRLNDKAHKKYIGILVESDIFKSFVRTIAGGSAQPNANAKDLTSFKFLLPPLPLQTRIADLLSAYDELIEVNNRRIALLEQTAEQLYKEWFVRLRFPGYTQTKVRKGMPEGWETEKIGDAFKISGGGTPSKKEKKFWEDGTINWYTPSDITSSKGIFKFNSELKCTENGYASSSAKMFPAYSIMMTSRATIGAFGINTTEACTNQGFITSIPNASYPLYFLFNQLKLMVTSFKQVATGATFPEISRGSFKKIDILKPESNLVERFEKIVKPMYEKIQTLQAQNQTLRRTRDLLLPRLISGQLSVAEAETALNA